MSASLFTPESWERLNTSIARVLESGTPYEEELEMIRADRSHGWMLAMGEPLRDDAGAIIGVQGAAQDITERRLAEKALNDALTVSDAAQRIAGVGSWDWTVATGALAWSEEFYRIYGQDSASFTPTYERFLGTVHPDDREKVKDAVEAAVRGEKRYHVEHRIVRPDGVERYIEEQGEVERDDQGAPIRMVGVGHDITERRLADKALNASLKTSEKLRAEAVAARKEAEAANKAKSDFLANMSHELRTPLNGVIGITEILLEGELRGHQRKQLELVKSSGDTLLSLVNDVLDLARIEAGRFALDKAPFYLIELVEETGAQHAIQAHGRELELIVSVAEGAPSCLKGDANRLRQVMANLLGNAIKFTHKGEVSLRVDVAETNESDTLLHFAIRDSGIGIPKEKLATIFQRFTQGDESVTRQYGGAGLGTTIAKQFVELMGGDIWAESEVGKGTTFHFTARFERCDDIEEMSPAPPEELRSLRVLIVDDNETNRIVLHNIVSSWGMEYVEAASGAEAIEQIGLARQRHEKIDLILMDYHMPGYDGVEAAQMIRASRQGPRPLIILLSSVVGGMEERMRDAEIDGFITKPIRRSVLLNMILSRMGKKSVLKTEGGRHSPHIVSDKILSILLVEDNDVNREVARYALNQIDHTLDHALNGAEGVAMWKEKSYDLILMDIHMPVMDGLEATRLIREEERKRGGHTPIIAMTARAMEQDRLDCLEAGMDDYIAKPVKKADVVTMVVNLLHLPPPVVYDPSGERRQATYDLTNMRMLVEGDLAGLALLVTQFVKATADELDELKRALQRGEATLVERLAHSAKGNLAQLGADALSQMAHELEKRGKSGELGDGEELRARLEAGFAHLREGLKKEIG